MRIIQRKLNDKTPLFASEIYSNWCGVRKEAYLPGTGESVISEADPPGRGPSIAPAITPNVGKSSA